MRKIRPLRSRLRATRGIQENTRGIESHEVVMRTGQAGRLSHDGAGQAGRLSHDAEQDCPPGPPLTRMFLRRRERLRLGIHAFAGHIHRLEGHG